MHFAEMKIIICNNVHMDDLFVYSMGRISFGANLVMQMRTHRACIALCAYAACHTNAVAGVLWVVWLAGSNGLLGQCLITLNSSAHYMMVVVNTAHSYSTCCRSTLQWMYTHMLHFVHYSTLMCSMCNFSSWCCVFVSNMLHDVPTWCTSNDMDCN